MHGSQRSPPVTNLGTDKGGILLLIVTPAVAAIEENELQLRGPLVITTTTGMMTGPTVPVAPMTTIGTSVMTTEATPLVADRSMAFPHPILRSS